MSGFTFGEGREVRSFRPTDIDAVFAINEASTPGVSRETREDLLHILTLGHCRVIEDAALGILGFVNLVEPGTAAYESLNLRWFEAWQARDGVTQIYVDRIALAPKARGQNLGEQLYRLVAAEYADRDFITAEVNTLPDNPGSHRFHQRLGFKEVGTQTFVPGEKAVAYYALKIG